MICSPAKLVSTTSYAGGGSTVLLAVLSRFKTPSRCCFCLSYTDSFVIQFLSVLSHFFTTETDLKEHMVK